MDYVDGDVGFGGQRDVVQHGQRVVEERRLGVGRRRRRRVQHQHAVPRRKEHRSLQQQHQI